jgi:F-type H+-transporting ATPase subunit epsilon
MSDNASTVGSGLIKVELVAADREVWSGEATMVVVRTPEGDLGVLPNHEPVLAQLEPWPVTLHTPNGDVVASVSGGFLSVADNRVSILAETAELAGDVDVQRAERQLALAREQADQAAEARAESRLAAAAAHRR